VKRRQVVTVTTPHLEAWKVAMRIARGDARRLRVRDDGSVVRRAARIPEGSSPTSAGRLTRLPGAGRWAVGSVRGGLRGKPPRRCQGNLGTPRAVPLHTLRPWTRGKPFS
jgi:hypothetical protein